jgi:Ca-activated chloride channel family protein
MSFAAPAFLLALLLVPVSIALYLQRERGRRRAVHAFASPATMPSVAPHRPGWRRHAPMAAYAAVLAVLALALARPQATVAVPDERAAVVLVTDESGSMAARDVSPTRLEAARAAADSFVDDVPRGMRVGVVLFNNGVRAVKTPTRDRGQVHNTLALMRARGGTATGDAMSAALGLVDRRTGKRTKRAPAAIVLISDGRSTHGRDPLPVARAAARARIPVYTVALGTDTGTIQVPRRGGGTRTETVRPDRELLRRIAAISKGKAFEAGDAGELHQVYERLRSQVATKKEKREITAAFAAGGAFLLLVGGLMSVRWYARLP